MHIYIYEETRIMFILTAIILMDNNYSIEK